MTAWCGNFFCSSTQRAGQHGSPRAWIVAWRVDEAMFLIKIRTDERLMTSTFPEQYPRYRRQVPRLVPALRRRPHPVGRTPADPGLPARRHGDLPG